MKHYNFPKDKPVDLDENQRSLLTHALRTAAERYIECSHIADSMTGGTSLTEQFIRQAGQSRELADRIDNSEYIKFGKEVE